MKGLILLGDRFEDTEALTTIDVLLRAGEEIVRASVMDTLEVVSQYDLKIICDELLTNIDYKSFDYLIIPGGKASFTILDKIPLVDEVIEYFYSSKKLIAAICAAPHLLVRKGYFDNRIFTCFPGFETYSKKGIYRQDLGVYKDDRFVTAKSMYYSIDFALNILEFLYGNEGIEELKNRLKGE